MHTDEFKGALGEANKRRVWLESSKLKISMANRHNKYRIGKKNTEETKHKISESLKGRKLSEDTKRKIGEAVKGRHFSEEHKRKISKAHIGYKYSVEAKKTMSEAHKGKFTGKNNGNWRGGKTSLIFSIRTSFLYRQWRSDVFTRDNFTCQKCMNKKGGNLEAHHIKRLSLILEEYQIKTLQDAEVCMELWDINNGQTLCETHHKQTQGGHI